MKTFKDMRNIINEAYAAKKEGVMQPNGTDKVGSINSEVDKSTNKDLAKACWKGYTAVGTKKKNGKTVPNCVPEEVKTENVKVNPNARETETQNASDKKSKAKASYNQTVQKIKGMRMEEENKKGFLQGAEAAKTGKKYSENPHPKDSAEHLQWAKGHNQHRANKLTNESEIKDKKDNLPPHIKALMKKVSGKTMPSSKPTMKDVTPKGYGPNEEAEVDESTASKIVGNKLKNMNLQYRIPTPAERKAMFDKEQADKKAKKTIKKESHMLGFNDFIKESSCGTTKKVKETVKHPNQKALDVDGDGEIEASDLKALRDKKKSKDVKEGYKNDAQRKAVWASKNEEAEMDESITPQLVKQGIGIAKDKRYAGGNMTGATKAMDKLHPKLQHHPKVASALKTQNEEAEMDESYEKGRGSTGVAFAIKKGHPDAENPATRKKYPERQTPEYKAQWASKHKGTMHEDFDLDETTPVSFNKFKSMVEKYTGADRQADAKAKRESDPNYAYSDHYAKTSKSDSANKPKSTVHKGTYGSSYDGDDEKQEKKPESTDKRGRGRPSGSKSGARNKGAGVHDGGIPVHNLNLPNNRR